MLRTRLTALALVLSAGLAHAGIENAGTTSGNFLSVGTGAAILSMGGATLGSGRDVNASAWNPAALGFQSSSQYALSHAALALDVSQDWFAGSGRLGRSQTRWSASALYQNDGSFEGRDAFGAPTGSFSVSNLALGLAVARPLMPDVTAGGRVFMLNETLGSESGSGVGFDLGVQAQHGPFGFGAAARNLGGQMKYDAASYDLPGVFGVGASWLDERRGLRFAVDANFPKAYYNDVRLGGEWMWQQRVALRAGYRHELGAPSGEPLGGPSFGFGTGVNGFWFDYAFLAGDGQAQGAHRLGVTFSPSYFNRSGAQRADGTPADGSSASTTGASAANSTAEPKATETKATEPKATESKSAAVAAPSVSAPVTASASAPAGASAAVSAPAASKPSVAVPENASASSVAARPTRTTSQSLAPSKPVAVTKLATPTSQPVPAPTTSATPAPAATSAPAPVAASSSPVIAKVASMSPAVTVVRHTSPPVAQPAAPSGEKQARPEKVEVKKGESLSDIAKRWGTSVPAIMMENNLVSPNVKPGQKLRLPKS